MAADTQTTSNNAHFPRQALLLHHLQLLPVQRFLVKAVRVGWGGGLRHGEEAVLDGERQGGGEQGRGDGLFFLKCVRVCM